MIFMRKAASKLGSSSKILRLHKFQARFYLALKPRPITKYFTVTVMHTQSWISALNLF